VCVGVERERRRREGEEREREGGERDTFVRECLCTLSAALTKISS